MDGVGTVERKVMKLNLPEGGLKLAYGGVLKEVNVAYEECGAPLDGYNAIYICHALTGDAHVAGIKPGEEKPSGWWEGMVGPGRAIDTNKYHVICANVLGGCSGTTGPSSINPETGKPYGLSFPVITMEDAVKVQKILVDSLGIKKMIVAGGSMGGMQALEWAVSYPEYVSKTIVIASTARLSAQGIAFNAVGRNAILSDINFNNGDYYDKTSPEKGLAVARMIGHITYLCEESMHKKFGRRFQDKDKPDFDLGIDFQVESYLRHQGMSFVERFDANSYLYITKAVDYFDLAEKYGTLEDAFRNAESSFLIISFTSDWLFPSSQSKEMTKALVKAGKDVSYCEIQSPCGHDAFLLEFDTQTEIIKSFLKR